MGKKNTILSLAVITLSSFITFISYANPIKITNPDGAEFTCEFTSLSINDGNTTPSLVLGQNLTGETCNIGGPIEEGGTLELVSPAAGIIPNQAKSPAQFSWTKVADTTHYRLRVYQGTINNPGSVIFEKNLKSDGSAVQIAAFNQYCENVSGNDCVIPSPYLFYNYSTNQTIGSDLEDGDYHWQVTVVANSTTVGMTDAKRNFTIDAEVETEASESTAIFDQAIVNQSFNEVTGSPDYSTKSGLITLLDTPPYNSYQELAGGKKVFIVNKSSINETVIPSCVNGKRKTPTGVAQNCTVDMQFEQDEIYAIRGRSRSSGDFVNKVANQVLVQFIPAIYNITLSRFPGRMIANQSDDFPGRCSTSTNSAGSLEFSLSSLQGGDHLIFCDIPVDTRVYINVELAPNQHQCIPGANTPNNVCQMEIFHGFGT